MPLFLFTTLILLLSCNAVPNGQTGGGAPGASIQSLGDTAQQLGNNIMVIFQDSRNNHWFGSWETGLYKYDGKTIIHYTKKHGLPGNRVEEIREDASGAILINTQGGLCKFSNNKITKVTEALLKDTAWILVPGQLWFKGHRPGMVYRYDGVALHPLRIPKSPAGEAYLKKNPSAFDPYAVYCIYMDQKGHVWFGTALFGAARFNGKTFDWMSEPDLTEIHGGPANGVRAIAEDKDGYFWFNCEYKYKMFDEDRGSATQFYTREKSIGSLDGKINGERNEYLSIAKDNENNLWMVTYLHGVWKYDGVSIQHFPMLEDGKNIELFYIYNDRNGTLWLGTHKHGVWKFNGETFNRFIL